MRFVSGPTVHGVNRRMNLGLSNSTTRLLRSFDQDGIAILHDAIAPDVIAELRTTLPAMGAGQAGLRNLRAGHPVVRKAARASSVRAAAESVPGPSCFVV